MSRDNFNITPTDKQDDVYDTCEQGIAHHHHQRHQVIHSSQCGNSFQARDDGMEAPPISRSGGSEVPNPHAHTTTSTAHEEGDEVIATHVVPRRKKAFPQLAPAIEPETPQHTVTPSTTAAPSSPPGAQVTTTANDLERGEMATPPPPPPLQRPALVPGAFQVTGPGVRLFGRRHPSEDQRTVMTPIAAEVVQETPLVVAVPAPPDEQPQIIANWWTKRRNQHIVVAGVLTLVATIIVVVSVLIMSGNRGGTSLPDATPPPTNPQTPPMTLDPTTAFPTTAPPTNTTVMMTQSPTTLSPSTPVPTTNSPTMTTPTPVPTPVPTTVPATTAWQWTQMGQDIDGEAAGDWSGCSISLSADGTTVAIGAGSDDGGTDSGQVRVYQWNGGEWVQLGSHMDVEASEDLFGGRFISLSVSLSADGTTVAIGADQNDSNGDQSGHVCVYQWNGGDWVQLGKDMVGEAAYDYSGWSVSLSANGTTVAIGAPDNDGNGTDFGQVRVYQWNGGEWVQLGIDIDGEAADDYSGKSISLSADGTTVAIGAPENDGNGFLSGHVRVYQWHGGGWTKLGNDIDGEGTFDNSGKSVSLSADGTTVAIGADGSIDNESSSGHVRVHHLTGNDWIQVGSNLDGKSASDYSGLSVSLSADSTTVAIGFPMAGYDPGYVRVYQLSGDHQWIQVGSDLNGEAVGDYFGQSVSLSEDGSTVAVGAPYNDGNGERAGHVRVFRLEQQ